MLSSRRYSPYSQHRSLSLSERERQSLHRGFNARPRGSDPVTSTSRHPTNPRPTRRILSLATVQPTPLILIGPLATSPHGAHLPTEQGFAMTPIIPPNHQFPPSLKPREKRQESHLPRNPGPRGTPRGHSWAYASVRHSAMRLILWNSVPRPVATGLISTKVHMNKNFVEPT